MLNTTYRLNWPSVEMTSNIFYFGGLHAPQEVRDRRLILDKGTFSGPIREAINPENTLVYVGVNGRELEEGLSYDNHQQAMVIADLCSEFLSHGVDPSRISVMAAYRPHVKTINSVLNGTGVRSTVEFPFANNSTPIDCINICMVPRPHTNFNIFPKAQKINNEIKMKNDATTMTCKGICVRHKAPRPTSSGNRYCAGQKRCQVCEIFLKWDGLWCPCCGYRLRMRPRNLNPRAKVRAREKIAKYQLLVRQQQQK